MDGGTSDDNWPASAPELVRLQRRLGARALDAADSDAWSFPVEREATVPVIAGCFVAFARGQAGPGQPGDEAWTAAVAWRPHPSPVAPPRHVDHHLRGSAGTSAPRRADDLLGQAVVAGSVPARYVPGLLAAREGPLLAAAADRLAVRPDVLLVDGTGQDHPRRAGLAVHLGAVIGIPTVGVTRRPLVARGPLPELRRGAMAPLELEGRRVGWWVCTRTGARPIVAHAGWRTTPDTAAQTVLAASTAAARTPVPLQEARRVAREARALGTPLHAGHR